MGSALMIPPIYILITVAFPDTRLRARYFGAVSGAAGLGSAAGPLIGGLVTSSVSWRASFALQALAVGAVILLARRITDPPRTQPAPRFDIAGAALPAAGLFFVVLGILQSTHYGWFAAREDFTIGGTVILPKGSVSPIWIFVAIGALILLWFYRHLRSRERHGRDPLLATRLFHNHTSNRGLGTQLIQWLMLQGSFFVISVFLQQVRRYDAIRTGLMLTPATIGNLAASAAADRLARRRAQTTLIRAGFIISTAGMGLLLALVRKDSGVWTFIPGLFLMGAGTGVMLTSSVNVVQSSFPDRDQGDISGLSRGVSNLGSSLGTALAGSILVAASHPGGRPFAYALAALALTSLLGLGIAFALPSQPRPARDATGEEPRIRRTRPVHIRRTRGYDLTRGSTRRGQTGVVRP